MKWRLLLILSDESTRAFERAAQLCEPSEALFVAAVILIQQAGIERGNFFGIIHRHHSAARRLLDFAHAD